jgi:hypothetical protein
MRAPRKAMAASAALARTFQPANERPSTRRAAASQDGGFFELSSPRRDPASVVTASAEVAQARRPFPPVPFNTGMIDAEHHAVEHQCNPPTPADHAQPGGSSGNREIAATSISGAADVVGNALARGTERRECSPRYARSPAPSRRQTVIATVRKSAVRCGGSVRRLSAWRCSVFSISGRCLPQWCSKMMIWPAIGQTGSGACAPD